MHLAPFKFQSSSSGNKPGLLCLLLFICLQHTPLSSSAQYAKLHDFLAKGNYPKGSLVSDGTSLYGTTSAGGAGGLGTIFKIMPDGTGFAKLFDFDATNGSHPYGSLFYDGTFLFGTTHSGGSYGQGSIIKIKPDGTSISALYHFAGFSNSDGGKPTGDLTFDGTYFYGTTGNGGQFDFGTLFKIKPDGTGYARLLSFNGTVNGANPYGSLFYDGTFLYGMTSGGGANNLGAIFKIKPDGTGYAKMLDFNGSNGSTPNGSFISDGTFLYGMTSSGGVNNLGTIFKIKPDGTGYVDLLDFSGTLSGSSPNASLISDGTFLYGTARSGGTNNLGISFKIKTDGTGFTKLFDFSGVADGSSPNGSFYFDGTSLYGMTTLGGIRDTGTIFKIMPSGSGYSRLLDLDASGSFPVSSLISDGTFLYGLTQGGGTPGLGSVFKMMPDGSGFSTLYSFVGSTSNDGTYPFGSLFFDGTYLYGTTASGGSSQQKGSIFKIKPDGTGYVQLIDFTGTNGSGSQATLISDGTFLYGTAGILFKIKPDGTGFTDLLDFTGPNGSTPKDIFYDGTFLYGMTQNGGAFGLGTLYKIKPDGTSYSKLLDFAGSSDGSHPAGALISDGTFLYGMTFQGGVNGAGTIFKIKPDGTGYAKLLDFNLAVNGYNPTGSLVFDGTFLYGTASGPNSNYGTLFKIKTDGTGYADLLDLNGTTNGSDPRNLLLLGTSLYGVTNEGGILSGSSGASSIGEGTIFKYSLSGATISITTQPSDFIACAGDVATFTTAASGTTNLTYQWQFSVDGIVPFSDISNGGGYSNATTATLSVNTTGSFGVGRYRCKINGDLASTVFTSDKGLFINPLPTAPTTSGATACANTTFILSASGGADGQYVWYTVGTGGTSIAGQTNSSYTIPLLTVTTVYYVSINNGTCESARVPVTATVSMCSPPVIAVTPLATQIGGLITLNLVPLITTTNNNLDISSIVVTVQPPSGAIASVANGVLTINYNGISFSGNEQLTLRACDNDGNCATQVFSIDVAGDIIVYNGISPNGKNPAFIIEYINLFPDTKENSVYIFDRWENPVWHGSNYDNSSVVFTGVSDGGSDLPSGVYFYKINFSSGRKTQTGFLSLRRQ